MFPNVMEKSKTKTHDYLQFCLVICLVRSERLDHRSHVEDDLAGENEHDRDARKPL